MLRPAIQDDRMPLSTRQVFCVQNAVRSVTRMLRLRDRNQPPEVFMRRLFERSRRTDNSRRSLSAHEKSSCVRSGAVADPGRVTRRWYRSAVRAARWSRRNPHAGRCAAVSRRISDHRRLCGWQFRLGARSRCADFKTGTVSIGGVPANADILAAFVYGEAISANTATPPDPAPTGICP